jgi:glycosyltransferase involved in cell wall biosynthesis
MLSQLGEFNEHLEAVPEHSWTQVADTNIRLVLGAAARQVHLKLPRRLCYGLAQYRSVSRRELSMVRPDVIFAYERYPYRTTLPVLWMTGPIPSHEFHRRENYSAVKKEIAWKQECARKALRVICSTEFAKRAFCNQTGFDSDRVDVVPFLLPHLRGGGVSKATKVEDARLQCLFVGRDAIRKGLPRALKILREAPHWKLHVISSFADGPVDLPKGVTHQHGANQNEVLQWMFKADLLFSLSEYDSFGFAAVEAASRQCMPVFRAGSIQETMFSESAAMFLNDSWTPRDCVAAIDDKLGQEGRSTRTALLSEFRNKFSPESVARSIYLLAQDRHVGYSHTPVPLFATADYFPLVAEQAS